MSDPSNGLFARTCVGGAVYALFGVGVGHWLGGGMALGRLDAALLVPTLPVAALALLVSGCFRGVRPVAAMLLPTFLLLLLSGVVLGVTQPFQAIQMAVIGLSSLLLLGLVHIAQRAFASRSGVLRAAILLLMAATWWLTTHVALGAAYTARWASQPGKTVVITGLPLRTWPADGLQLASFTDAAAIVALRQQVARPLILADGLAAGSLSPEDRLLLAHPLALPPETLVEVDRFVRSGGRAVILADGLSGWPPPYPLGDARNPPVTSLLTPLLDHWGVRLDAPPGGAGAGSAQVKHQGWRLNLHSTGHFAVLPRHCRGAGRLPDLNYSIAICRIGRGTAVLLADADLLFDPLWRPDPLWAGHLRQSDNIEWLADQLNAPQRPQSWGLRPTWH